ncbi:MAG: ester cyclase [Candidatus Hodarchaeales archaeon]|jgi:predicted ester cyclase
MKAHNEEIGRLWLEEMWSKPDLAIADRIVDENYNPSWIQIDEIGPAQIKHEITYFRSAFPDLKYEIIEIIGEKEKVWIHYKGTGTHKGNAWGFKPTYKNVEFEEVIILYINPEGKVINQWGAFCLYDILADLGLVPPFWELSKHFFDRNRE